MNQAVFTHAVGPHFDEATEVFEVVPVFLGGVLGQRPVLLGDVSELEGLEVLEQQGGRCEFHGLGS